MQRSTGLLVKHMELRNSLRRAVVETAEASSP